MTANEIRDSFKKFYESKGHTIVPSAPMVIKDDPTLMFTNAGMNQWKDIILGTREPEPRRRADTQKCLRVSGKHNDLVLSYRLVLAFIQDRTAHDIHIAILLCPLPAHILHFVPVATVQTRSLRTDIRKQE